MTKSITILGMGPTARERRIDIAKYLEGTEVWSLNNAYITYPDLKFDRYFELHGWDYLKSWVAGRRADGSEVDYFYDLDALACPVYVSQYIPLVKKQTPYPYVEVFRHFGVESCYWLGSPSLMLALAIYEHDTDGEISEIRSWGIDTGDDRHKQQRASWAWWLSKAQDRGIKITGSALDFHSEHDNDAGLSGLREIVRERLNKQQETEQ